MITNAVSFEAPSGSARVIVSGAGVPVASPLASPFVVGMPDVIPRYWQFSRKARENSSWVSGSSPNSFSACSRDISSQGGCSPCSIQVRA
jgi:hypothetical protein